MSVSQSIETIYLQALNQALKPALGCTEPLTVALAAAYARHYCSGELLKMTVKVSANLYKNAAGVYVPGTGMTGLPIAAACGWWGGDWRAGLQVLGALTQDDLYHSKVALTQQRIQVDYQEHADVFYTQMEITTSEGQGVIIMGGRHDGLCQASFNDHTFVEQIIEPISAGQTLESCWQVASIIEFIEQVALDKLAFIEQCATLNSKLSQFGLQEASGLAIGASLVEQQRRGFLSDDLISCAMIDSAGASDARMAGAPYAAMSNSGSGNQGIAATMPVVAVANRLQITDEQRLRALAMSHLLAVYIKKLQSPLSALCAATTAAMGAGAAINWLLGGDEAQVTQTIRYMIGDISGVYCDGAKPGCALKVSTGAQAAVKAALLALTGRKPASDGMLEESVDLSLAHLGTLTYQPLQATDQAIVEWIACREVSE